MTTVQKVAQAAKRAFKSEGLLIKQFNEAAAGQTIYHLHVHILPRRAGEELRTHAGKMADQALLARHAEMIRAEIR